MANVNPVTTVKAKHYIQEPLPILTNEMQSGVTSGSAATVVFTAPADKGVAITELTFAYRTTPTAGSIQIADGTQTWGPFTVAAAGFNFVYFNPPLLFTKGANVTVTLADGSVTKDLFARAFVEGGVLF